MVKYYGTYVKNHYKTWEIGYPLPEANYIIECLIFEDTRQGYYFWYDLYKGYTPYSIDHYNALAEIFDEPPFEEKEIDIEDFM